MHTLAASFVLGYHGYDAEVAERVLGGEDFRSSDNDYDWLGPGVYFWESDPRRGRDYATELAGLKRGPAIVRPAVIGAVIDLGLCLDLTTTAGIDQVQLAYNRLKRISDEAGWVLPVNSESLLRRNLDCAVIRTLHEMRDREGLDPVDAVRGVFVEGAEAYPGSGFRDKTHVQNCVRNLDCIKGVFRVPDRFLR